MERELYKSLDLDLRISRLNKHYILSPQFETLHDSFVGLFSAERYFDLSLESKVQRRDQILLHLQYRSLLYGYGVYPYTQYLRYCEEFFTYFLNYELTTGRCSPQFPQVVRHIFDILNKYVKE